MAENEKFESKYDEGWETNFKGLTDAWNADWLNGAKQRAGLQDQVNNLFLQNVQNAQALMNQVAQWGAAEQAREARNAGTWDNLVFAGEVDTTAQGAMGAKIAADVGDAAKKAIDEAIASAVVTSPPAQGTTGVAQGALQTQTPIELATVLNNQITTQTAILARLAQITDALAVILVKVTAEEVVTK
jgi:hypothetical protein